MLLLRGVHFLQLVGVLALRLLNLMEGPQFLVLHYTLDHRLDREGFFADAPVEHHAELATTTLPIIIFWT